MKNIILKDNCQKCDKLTDIRKLYRFTWRWNDKNRKYKSGIHLIHTGYHFLCKSCLKLITK